MLKKIRLNLARDHDYPNGSTEHGYQFVAPLGADDRLDREVWKTVRERCYVHRFWAGEDDEDGHLIRTRGGNWAFHYDLTEEVDDDEVGYRFADHTFALGDYVSIREHDGDLKTFRVVGVNDLPPET